MDLSHIPVELPRFTASETEFLNNTFPAEGDAVNQESGSQDARPQAPAPGEAAEIFEKREWEALILSKEWRAADRHLNLCEERIAEIRSKISTLYKNGNLELYLREEDDIRRGVNILLILTASIIIAIA